MGCNCGKSNTKMKYVYTDPNGRKITYTSQVQAQAAVIKNGGGTWREERA